jgi:hypothetical protein
MKPLGSGVLIRKPEKVFNLKGIKEFYFTVSI